MRESDMDSVFVNKVFLVEYDIVIDVVEIV